jgi:hypothetical protein
MAGAVSGMQRAWTAVGGDHGDSLLLLTTGKAWVAAKTCFDAKSMDLVKEGVVASSTG